MAMLTLHQNHYTSQLGFDLPCRAGVSSGKQNIAGLVLLRWGNFTCRLIWASRTQLDVPRYMRGSLKGCGWCVFSRRLPNGRLFILLQNAAGANIRHTKACMRT